MKQEWPIGHAEAEARSPQNAWGAIEEGAQPFLPLAMDEHVAAILASPAAQAFARKRAVQVLQHGHTPDKDLERTIDYLVAQAKYRLQCFMDYSGRDRLMNPPPERRDQLIRYVEIAGALLIAAWERLQAEVPEDGQ